MVERDSPDFSNVVQYYVAERGRLSDGALALLAARGALLGHARWRRQPVYARWHDQVMTKVVLACAPEEMAVIRAGAPEALALGPDGEERTADQPATLLVLPPQPRPPPTSVLRQLRLAPRARGSAPEPADRPVLLLVAASDLGMHGGKLAAQCAHAALLAQAAYNCRGAWADWIAKGRPLALRATSSAGLADSAARYPAGTVRDAGHTQVAAGSLTVVALPPGATGTEQMLAALDPW